MPIRFAETVSYLKYLKVRIVKVDSNFVMTKIYCFLGQTRSCNIRRPHCGYEFMCQRGRGKEAGFYCCKRPQCFSGSVVVDTVGHPVYCNPASPLRCWADASCQEAVNMRGNYVCCLPDDRKISSLNRCIGTTTYLSSGRPFNCLGREYICPQGNEVIKIC